MNDKVKADLEYLKTLKKEDVVDENGFIICPLCTKRGLTFLPGNFGRHLKKHFITTKEFFDAILLDGKIGKCVVCGKQTKFISMIKGYSKVCSTGCNVKRISSPEFTTEREKKVREEGTKWRKRKRKELLRKKKELVTFLDVDEKIWESPTSKLESAKNRLKIEEQEYIDMMYDAEFKILKEEDADSACSIFDLD